MVADVLTKPLGFLKFLPFVAKMMNFVINRIRKDDEA